ncbi:MAG TPA: Asp-tRNA(Asn)/Glu-tRNA(Gln) amidotransferase GatCAB subunit C [Bacteroidetes bacterium]|nr:Asp-tRNA(Asn)/Glu-tRNA(Gln) amidotransferase GatCAB subunit C [Bacteroidota bacterium]
MAVTIKEVEHIAKLAKLKFSIEETEKLQGDLNKILEYIDELNEVNLDDTEPMENINELVNVTRKDEIIKGLSQEEALKNAPEKTGNYFKVPKVIDK